EDGGGIKPPDVTTLAVGEEGGTKPPITTLAVGEEGGDPGSIRTMAPSHIEDGLKPRLDIRG
ncbi:MAG: hypothetical protein QF437_29035, partial [Planctomycetota bacterium]|nr:hypothetical protein [Planctomycetota bacterium]